MSRARAVLRVISLAMVLVGAGAVSGQNYPTKPIRILASEPGNFLETAARLIAQEIAGPLGQPVIIENRPSALIPDLLFRATPDGYTVGMGSGVFWVTPLIQKTSYDPVKDFSAITSVVTYPALLVVHPSVPVKSVKELIDLAKAKPGTLNIAATASPGGQSFLSAELFKGLAGVNLVRVPYKSNTAGLIDLLAGEVQIMFLNLTEVSAHIKSGRLRALAVTSVEPFPAAPSLPTLAAAGVPGYESILIAGMLAPGATPAAIINRLNQEMVRVLKRPDVKEKFLNSATEALGSSPAEFAAKIKSEMAKWAKVLKDAGVRAE